MRGSDAQVAGPSFELRRFAQPADVASDVEVGLLGDVLGPRALTQDAVRDTECASSSPPRFWLVQSAFMPGEPEMVTATSGQAIDLCDRGDDPGARDLYERVLEARTRVLGLEHPAPVTTVRISRLDSSVDAAE